MLGFTPTLKSVLCNLITIWRGEDPSPQPFMNKVDLVSFHEQTEDSDTESPTAKFPLNNPLLSTVSLSKSPPSGS